MEILIYGSLAYDRIMTFEGQFSDHILPNNIDSLSVSFNVNSMREMLGGTAGNIAYGLTQLGEKPAVLGSLGRDGSRYLEWMQNHGIKTEFVRLVDDQFTAGCFITNDCCNNMINSFNPGAMYFPCNVDEGHLKPSDSLAIVAPGGKEDMSRLPELYRKVGLPFIFDPGQSLNIWQGEELKQAMDGAMTLISNEYELEIIQKLTGLDLKTILENVESVITTMGEKGSLVRRKDSETFIPAAPPDEVNDPTGAGDAYRSGLLKGLSNGLSLEEAALWGSAISSFAVACHGTQEYCLEEGQFEERLAKVKKLFEN
ncbi:carbohydrate kinase family protein [Dethiosulfatarculus sandiegensis]|uniref:Carbohydrate kinase n=1 Tax=Dethiosulfatarculus sandiegensis TaxID=1429043 RepID=A0A0D2HS60_9BACT|nr:carbohydrate kinase family protein [Dethiosulfatarculus sandiegensis]KIX13373.1 carbohydrate kinase [Dethiosulfatarculus sandiegensis]